MKHASPLLIVMGAGLAVGAFLLIGGGAAGSDLGSLAAGYGVLFVASSLFLGLGLAIRRLVAGAGSRQPAMRTPVRAVEERH